MTTFLRRSGQIARISRQSLEAASRSHPQSRCPSLLSRCTYAPQRVRRYATVQPEDPKDPKDGKKKASKSDDSKVAPDAGKEPGKQAPGFEHFYNNSSPVSPPPEGKKDGSKPATSKLTLEEEKALDGLLANLKMGMPAAQARDLERAFKEIKEEGIPVEVREVMEKLKGGAPMDLATAAKLVRMTTQMARKAAEKSTASSTPEDEAPQQKAGAHDPGPRTKEDSKKQGRKQSMPEGMKELNFKFNFDMGTFLMSAFVTYLLYRLVVPGENSREITWQEFRNTFLDKGLVEKIVVLNRNHARVYLHRDAVAAMYPESPAAHGNFHYYFSIGSIEAFERRLDEAQTELGIPSSERIPVAYQDEMPWLATILSFGPTLLFVGAIFWLSRRAAAGAGGQSGIFGMGRSRAKKFNHETDVKVKFADVAGMDEAKQEIMEFVSFLKEPGIYQKLGAKIPRGAILSGPPGTGKTLLAKATAGESQVPFFSVSGSEFVEMFVGVGPSRVRDLFANARKNTPCIIFIDEIDAIGKSRAKQSFGGGNDERESTLNQILTEMDGFNTSEQVVVLAGTNRPDVLDKALLRPGRFDRHIVIDKPTMDGRKQIFVVHLKKIVTKEDIESLCGRLAALTPGFSGADIANCVNEAALIAARYHAESVEMKHFEQAIERVIGGLEKKSLVLSPEEKKTVAYHEAGHAICGWFFKYADPLLKVSIIPRGQGALGYAQYLPSGDTYLMNVNQLMDRMAMTLAGRVSEELHFDTVTTGASDDFNKVTRMAAAMVTKWGMSRKIGYLYFEDDSSQQLHKPFSEDTAKNIDAEVRRIVDEAYKQCRDLLTEKKKEIGLVAEELLKKEMLTRDDLIRILGPRPFEDNQDFTKYFGSRGDREGAGGGVPTPPSPPPATHMPGDPEPAPTVFRDVSRSPLSPPTKPPDSPLVALLKSLLQPVLDPLPVNPHKSSTAHDARLTRLLKLLKIPFSNEQLPPNKPPESPFLASLRSIVQPILTKLHTLTHTPPPPQNSPSLGPLTYLPAFILTLLVLLLTMSWSSRFGSRLGTWSPFGRPGQPAEVTDEGFSYITAADLDNNNISPLPSTPHSQRRRDTDVLVLKHKKVSYPVHFPAYSIEDGELIIGELRSQAAKKIGVKDPARIKMFYRGKNLKDDARTAREEGLRNDAELMCVVGDAPLAPPSKSEDEESEETGLEDGGAEAKPKRKRNRGKKGKKSASKKTTPTASDSGYNTDGPRPAQQPPPPAQPQTPVQKLEAIAAEFHRTLVPQCIQFTASPPSDPAKREFEHKRLAETILAQVLLKLDAVETEGDPEARAKRKELVREVQGMLAKLDEVVR